MYILDNTKITDKDAAYKIAEIIKVNELDSEKEYDITVEFCNSDLDDNFLEDEAMYEIKREHLVFIKNVRNVFLEKGILINIFSLIGTVSKLNENEIEISLKKSKHLKYKNNDIIPCKEIIIYNDTKKRLDLMLAFRQISEKEYEDSLIGLQDELNLYTSENLGYIN